MKHPYADSIKHHIEVGPKGKSILVNEDTDMTAAKLEKDIAGHVGEAIRSLYPTRPWRVHVDLEGKVVVIFCPVLSARKGYLFPMEKMNIHQLEKKAKWAAGNILERYGVSRNKMANPSDVFTLPTELVRPSEVYVPDAVPETGVK